MFHGNRTFMSGGFTSTSGNFCMTDAQVSPLFSALLSLKLTLPAMLPTGRAKLPATYVCSAHATGGVLMSCSV